MPIIPENRRRSKSSPEELAADRIERFLLSLRESKRNPENLCGRYDDKYVTIFVTREGRYQFSIDDGELLSYSKDSFAEQDDAAAALLDVLEREGV